MRSPKDCKWAVKVTNAAGTRRIPWEGYSLLIQPPSILSLSWEGWRWETARSTAWWCPPGLSPYGLPSSQTQKFRGRCHPVQTCNKWNEIIDPSKYFWSSFNMVIGIIGLPDRSCHQRSGSLKTHSPQTAGRMSCPIPEEIPERVQFEKSSFSTREDSLNNPKRNFKRAWLNPPHLHQSWFDHQWRMSGWSPQTSSWGSPQTFSSHCESAHHSCSGFRLMTNLSLNGFSSAIYFQTLFYSDTSDNEFQMSFKFQRWRRMS